MLKWGREWQKKNKEYVKQYKTKHVMIINGKYFSGLNKREYKGYCELCGKENTHLNYHHWDSKNLNKGMWVCNFPCHQICEIVDKGFLHIAQRYLRFKRTLDKKMKRANVQRRLNIRIY